MYSQWIEMSSNDPEFFNKIVMGDESWCFSYNPESKWQSATYVGRNSPKVKKLRFQKFCVKTILVAFSDCKGASTLCRAAECNTLQLYRMAKVARHMPPMRSRPHEKIIFCRPSSYQNCGTRLANLVWFFSQTGWYHFETLIHHMPRGFFWGNRQFADRIFRPRSIEQHAAAKLMQRPHILVTWRNFYHATLPHFAAVCHAA